MSYEALQLHYKKYGTKGQTIVIAHGLFGMLDNWHTLAKELALQFQVYLIDLRNHGRSPFSDTMTYQAMAADLSRFIADHQLDDVILVGHSMGGKAAMKTALTYPDILKALVVVDISPERYPEHHDNIIEALCRLQLDKVESRSQAEAMLKESIHSEPVRLFLLKNLKRADDGGYAWKMNLPVLETPYANIVEEIGSESQFEKPTLFVMGDSSRYISSSSIPLIEKLFANYHLESIRDAGHWVHAEAPDAFRSTLTQFIAEYVH